MSQNRSSKSSGLAGCRSIAFRCLFILFLLVLAGLLSQTFFHGFKQAAIDQELWVEEEFWFFTMGAIFWVLAFFGGIWAHGKPWPIHVYVLGHELTHAVWVWIWGGRTFDRKLWSADGGYIVTNKHNFWIALAPYFYPIYSLVVIVCYGVAALFFDVTRSTGTFLLMTPLQWLFFLLGLTWSFHFTFTVWMIPKGQTDLTAHGTFFSLTVIYNMNLLLLAISLIVVSPEITFASFGAELITNVKNFGVWGWKILRAMWLHAVT